MDREQILAALADEFRRALLARLSRQPASTTQLARSVGRPKGTVGYHLKVLERAGLIRVARTRRVRAVTEKYYAPVGDDLSSFGVVHVRVLEADAEHFVRRLEALLTEFEAAETRTGRTFTLVAALYAGGEHET